MSDAGLYAPVQWFDYGRPDTADDPVKRAELQASAQTELDAAKTTPGYVAPGFHALRDPVQGWTVQNASSASTGPFQPSLETGAANMGRIPDWTSDANSIGAGRYDQNPTVTAFPPNRLNEAPIGSIVFDGYSDSGDTNPNFLPQDQGGTLDLEY